MILINELLYKDTGKTIYKTYCPTKRLFGLAIQTASGTKELRPEFAHIFDLLEKEKLAVATKAGDFKWVGSDLLVGGMTHAEENMFSILHMRNSLCNCFKALASSDCYMCRKGIIRNPLNFRRVGSDMELAYEFETEKCKYRITLAEGKAIGTSYDFLWSMSEFEYNIQEAIEHFEAAELDFKQKELEICTYEPGSGELLGQILLKKYTLVIELADISLSVSLTKDRIYLDLF